MIDKIFQSGLQGMLSGLERASLSADQASRAFQPDGDGDLATPITELALSKVQVAASAKVIKTGDELSKTLLEIA